MIPQIGMGMIDEREVVLGHIKAMAVPEAARNRQIMGIPHTLIELAEALDKEFRSQGYNVPIRVAPNFFIRLYSWFDAQEKTTLPYLGKPRGVNNDRMIKVLGIEPSDISEAVVTMAYSLIKAGIVKKKHHSTMGKHLTSKSRIHRRKRSKSRIHRRRKSEVKYRDN